MSDNGGSSGGAGVVTIALVVLVTLKLAEVEPVASWSWLWVVSPLWMALSLAACVFVLGATMIGIGSAFSRVSSWREKRQRRKWNAAVREQDDE